MGWLDQVKQATGFGGSDSGGKSAGKSTAQAPAQTAKSADGGAQSDWLIDPLTVGNPDAVIDTDPAIQEWINTRLQVRKEGHRMQVEESIRGMLAQKAADPAYTPDPRVRLERESVEGESIKMYGRGARAFLMEDGESMQGRGTLGIDLVPGELSTGKVWSSWSGTVQGNLDLTFESPWNADVRSNLDYGFKEEVTVRDFGKGGMSGLPEFTWRKVD